MSIEKLKQALSLIQECIDEYQGEESDEGDTSDDGSSYESESSDSGNDKIKMAAALMKRGR
jgi:hypothetical protein